MIRTVAHAEMIVRHEGNVVTAQVAWNAYRAVIVAAAQRFVLLACAGNARPPAETRAESA